jgi:hypothetical protein
MVTYTELRRDRKRFLALTGLTLPEFELLVLAFTRAYEDLYPPDGTLSGHSARPGGCDGRGRPATSARPGRPRRLV